MNHIKVRTYKQYKQCEYIAALWHVTVARGERPPTRGATGASPATGARPGRSAVTRRPSPDQSHASARAIGPRPARGAGPFECRNPRRGLRPPLSPREPLEAVPSSGVECRPVGCPRRAATTRRVRRRRCRSWALPSWRWACRPSRRCCSRTCPSCSSSTPHRSPSRISCLR